MSAKKVAIACGIMASLLVSPAVIAKSEKPMAGKALAEMVCARCHEVTIRTVPGRSIGDGSPPAFVMIAQDSKMTPAALYEFLRFPHGAMDYLFVTQQEVDSLIIYIQSLKAPPAATDKRR